MKKLHIIFILLFVGIGSLATSWTPTTAAIKFNIKNAGLTVDGSLSGLVASVDFDPTNLATSKISASVKVNTIKTGISARDAHLVKEEYFNAAKFPKIEMVSTSFSKASGGGYIGKFNLTIKGKTKNIAIPFTFTESKGNGTFKGNFSLDRLTYEVGETSMVLGDNVKVSITLNSTKK